MRRGAYFLIGTLVLAGWSGGVAARMQSPSTNDGVYTAVQASDGKELFVQACETCHQPAKFVGAEFVRAYEGRPLDEVNRSMAEMPQDNPGTLKTDDVAALIAYFLQMNHYPAGQTPLSGEADALKRIMVAPRK